MRTLASRCVGLLLLAAICAALVLPAAAEPDPCAAFTDLNMDTWYHEGIHFAVTNGLMKGVASDRFAPDTSTSRAMLVTILYRFDGAPPVSGGNGFSDVKAGSWYEKAVQWAAREGIVGGYGDGRFGPNDDITREQAVTILCRYLRCRGVEPGEEGDISGYSDAASVHSWARAGLCWALGAGVLRGISTEAGPLLAPQGKATRAQIAALLQRAARWSGLTPAAFDASPLNDQLKPSLESLLADKEGAWCVYVERLSTGEGMFATTGPTEQEALVSASVIKLFIMGAVFQRLETGALTHEQVDADLNSMIQISNNQAANRLTRLLGGGDRDAGIAAVNAFARGEGCTETTMTRLMLENTGTQNYVSVRDCAGLLRKIYSGELVSADASSSMLEIMKGTQRMYAAKGLPEEVAFAHKTGSLTYLCFADVGIVLTEEPYLICIFNTQTGGEAKAAAAMEAISRLVFEQMKEN